MTEIEAIQEVTREQKERVWAHVAEITAEGVANGSIPVTSAEYIEAIFRRSAQRRAARSTPQPAGEVGV